MTNDSDWTQARPTEEGWWFWRRAKNVTDKYKWNAYFVMLDDFTDVSGVSLYESGCCVRWPSGGWWKRACE